MIAVFGVTLPFGAVQLPRDGAIVTSLISIYATNNAITAVLLYSQFSIGRSLSILMLATGYLLASLMAVPWAFTFPGVFISAEYFGSGPQTTGWIYHFCELAFSILILAYASLKGPDFAGRRAPGSVSLAIGGSAAGAFVLVCIFTWLATRHTQDLPILFADVYHYAPAVAKLGVANVLINLASLGLLLKRRRSVLDQWLIAVVLAQISEAVLIDISTTTRFSVGYYAGRVFTVVISSIVLAALISEVTRLHARLARSAVLLQREQRSKLMNLAVMSAAISHEVRQPLMAIAMNGGAALQYLKQAPPELGEARSVIDTIVHDCHRASQMFEGVGGLFTDVADLRQETVDLNKLTARMLRNLSTDLKERGITAEVDLQPNLPLVTGNVQQLEEVVLNLMINAIDAMESIEDAKILRVTTSGSEADEIYLIVEDTGREVSREQLAGLFDALVVSTSKGDGLGLAFSQMIVQRHGGQIEAYHRRPARGTLLRVTLPRGSPASDATAIRQ